MLLYLILSHAFRYIFARRTPLKLSTDTLYRTYFFLGASLVYISVTNGFSLLIILTICTVNYAIAKIARGSRWNPILTWVFNIGLLFVNARYEGYRFGVLDPTLAWMVCVVVLLLICLFTWFIILFWSPPHSHARSIHPGRLSRSQSALAHPLQLHHASPSFI